MQEGTEKDSIGVIFRELTASFNAVVRSEIRLAKAEFSEAGGQLARQTAQAGVFGALAALGILPLLAFFVIGLGKLLGDNYWLSSLIIAVVAIAVGGALAIRSFQKMKSLDLTFTHTRESLGEEARVVNDKIRDIGQDLSHGTRRAA